MKEKLHHALLSALHKLASQIILPNDIEQKIQIDPTRDKQHGDYTTNIAMSLAKITKQKPRELAQLIIDHMTAPTQIETVEIAGSGFINFYLTNNATYEIIPEILKEQNYFGRTSLYQGQKANVEFVSANPTGPLHVGHGRGASYGAVIANLLECVGYQVDREYYVNDSGRQMHILATSVWLRYLSLFNELPHFPSNGYQGEYLFPIAKKLQSEQGEVLRKSNQEIFSSLPRDADENGDAEIYIDALIARTRNLLGEKNYSIVFEAAMQNILTDIKEDLEEFNVIFNNWFSESSLVTSGDIQKGINLLDQRGYIYEKDGALWFKATVFGDEKDRVVRRENGQTTYFASDIAYHLNKFERGYQKIIDVLGADHHGYAPRIRAFIEATKLDPKKFEVLLVQFAILYRNKQKVAMSTRSGEFITLRELRKEVGNDAARFFYIMRKNDQHLDFDLDLAKSQSADNPVYYIQYAHARICSVMRQLDERQLTFDQQEGLKHLFLLKEAHEEQLIYRLHRYKDVLENAAINYAPHLLTHYLQELANEFHTYYNAHHFIASEQTLRNARLCLVLAIKQVIANSLTILGISKPEVM